MPFWRSSGRPSLPPARAMPVPSTDVIRRAALQASWKRDRRIGGARLAWRWSVWLGRWVGLPSMAVVGAALLWLRLAGPPSSEEIAALAPVPVPTEPAPAPAAVAAPKAARPPQRADAPAAAVVLAAASTVKPLVIDVPPRPPQPADPAQALFGPFLNLRMDWSAVPVPAPGSPGADERP